ncbi:MAG: ribbon-helix-helix domain-containing protein [Methylococcaceae bacterium]
MRTVQMTLDDELVDQVDQVIKTIKTTRSAFTRDALRLALKQFQTLEMEKKHLKGYEQFPVKSEEFQVWEDEQAWGDS